MEGHDGTESPLEMSKKYRILNWTNEVPVEISKEVNIGNECPV